MDNGNVAEVTSLQSAIYLNLTDRQKTYRAGSCQLHILTKPRLSYTELTDSDIRKLQRIRNMTAKIVTGVKKCDSSSTALKTLHWLPVHLRIKHKVPTLYLRVFMDWHRTYVP